MPSRRSSTTPRRCSSKSTSGNSLVRPPRSSPSSPHYHDQWLSRELAQQVAEQLSGRDALAAHIDAEHGIDLHESRSRPIAIAARTGVACAIGSVVVLLTAILTPSHWRIPSSFLAVALSLGLTSVVLARRGQVPVGRTVIRTVLIGMTAMLVTFAIGSWFEL
jgi:VIT1/CCC1 family predicted Fe2+/Mn2+ transporter